jgi:hypothetical protein
MITANPRHIEGSGQASSILLDRDRSGFQEAVLVEGPRNYSPHIGQCLSHAVSIDWAGRSLSGACVLIETYLQGCAMGSLDYGDVARVTTLYHRASPGSLLGTVRPGPRSKIRQSAVERFLE